MAEAPSGGVIWEFKGCFLSFVLHAITDSLSCAWCSADAAKPLVPSVLLLFYIYRYLLCDDSRLDNLENAAIKAGKHRSQLHFEDKATLISVENGNAPLRARATSQFAGVRVEKDGIFARVSIRNPFLSSSESARSARRVNRELVCTDSTCDRSSLYRRSVTSQFLLNLQDARSSSPLHLLVSMKSAPDHRGFDCSFCLRRAAVVPHP